MKRGILFFHQCWTDLIVQLSLIDYYLSIYESLTVILRPSAKPIYEFYLKDKPNLIKIYHDTAESTKINAKYLHTTFNPKEYDYLLHGWSDHLRIDSYQNAFKKSINNSYMHNVKKFYELYGIDFLNQIEYFQFSRDIKKEDEFYNTFLNTYNIKNSYILYHNNKLNDSTIKFDILPNVNYINLDGNALDIFFTIKVLQNAKEIYLIDSVWASFCYLIDAKYQLLKNIPIYLYPFSVKGRWGGLLKDITYSNELKLQPVNLLNWTIVK